MPSDPLAPTEMHVCSPKDVGKNIHISPVHNDLKTLSIFSEMDKCIVWVHEKEIYTTMRMNN